MKAIIHAIGYLLLAVSLVMAGVPVHALMDNSQSEAQPTLSLDAESDTVESSGISGCPYHHSDEAAAAEILIDDCCGPDCRCSCAGLTLMPVPQFDSPLSATPESRHAGEQQSLPSLVSTPLPRPPQS